MSITLWPRRTRVADHADTSVMVNEYALINEDDLDRLIFGPAPDEAPVPFVADETTVSEHDCRVILNRALRHPGTSHTWLDMLAEHIVLGSHTDDIPCAGCCRLAWIKMLGGV